MSIIWHRLSCEGGTGNVVSEYSREFSVMNSVTSY